MISVARLRLLPAACFGAVSFVCLVLGCTFVSELRGLSYSPALWGAVGRREPLHPPIERDLVDLDATLGEKLFEIPVGQFTRRYQRTANKITSGGKRKPMNPEGIPTGGPGR
jgi:hypothetical protein